HERGNGERSHDTQSIESDSRKIGQSHEQHAINFEHARQDVRRKRREFASDFDKWTRGKDRKSTRLNSSHVSISYAVFCLKKKKARSRNTSETEPLAD